MLCLDPLGKSGLVAKTVVVYSNDSAEPTQSIGLTADVEHSKGEVGPGRLGATLFGGSCAGCHSLPAAGLKGRELYYAVCSMCHGPEGQGGSAGSLARYSDEELKRGTAHGNEAEGMPGYARGEGGPLTPEQIDSLVEFFSRVR